MVIGGVGCHCGEDDDGDDVDDDADVDYDDDDDHHGKGSGAKAAITSQENTRQSFEIASPGGGEVVRRTLRNRSILTQIQIERGRNMISAHLERNPSHVH